MPVQKSGNVKFTRQKKFSPLFTTKDIDFMHFYKVFWPVKRNEIPVKILNPVQVYLPKLVTC